MTTPGPGRLNALQAWVVAFALCGLPAIALAWGLVFSGFTAAGLIDPPMMEAKSVVLVWLIPGLVGTAIWMRPVENYIRRVFFDLPSVETTYGTAHGDAVSDAAEAALIEAVQREMGRP
ncbi:hypothetical protein [Maricaulis salignorans]|uniref:Uncharacterized protein n=1 Tax=Maricaulis salignorans TaxID=144026 RepID=A0A1G9Q4S1_9PROT|nr:hypothetical protein [Maricaulis salignorans]SDM05335.1 hypothetical protein SAMN04488568_104140 [Maricaulis salignorans]